MAQLDNGKLFIAAGMGKLEGLEMYLKSALIYDPQKKGYTNLADLTSERLNPSCAFFDGKVYLVGMEETRVETAVFDPIGGTWTKGPSFPEYVQDQGSLAVLQGKIFYSDYEKLYLLEHNEWSPVEALQTGKTNRYHISLTVVQIFLNSTVENYCDFANF